jgi:hypothetical protein
MSRTREWPPSPFNAAPTFVWVSRSEVSSNSPSRDPNQQKFCWRVTRVRPFDAGPSGTKNAVALCHGGRPSFPPSPRAWPVMLGAADMPIGCALTFSEPAGPAPFASGILTAHDLFRKPVSTFRDHVLKRTWPGLSPAMQHQIDCGRYAVGWRSTDCRSRWRALRPKNRAWLTTAETMASWNGLAIRNAGSGRCPVRKRSG